MHGIESFLKGRDRIPIGNTFWKVPMLRGSLVLLPLIPCLSLCSLPCSSSRVGRSGPFFLFIQFQWVRNSRLQFTCCFCEFKREGGVIWGNFNGRRRKGV